MSTTKSGKRARSSADVDLARFVSSRTGGAHTVGVPHREVDPLYMPLFQDAPNELRTLGGLLKELLPASSPTSAGMWPEMRAEIEQEATQWADAVDSKLDGQMVLLDNPVPTGARALDAPLTTGRRAKKISSRERKALTSNASTTELKYAFFEPLHELWMSYMTDLLSASQSTRTVATTSASSSAQKVEWTFNAAAEQQIAKADFHGAILTVSRSKTPSLLGVSGIVVEETQNSFLLITKSDKIRRIGKRNCHFELQLLGHTVTLFGPHLCIRSADRSARKFKGRPTIQMDA